MKLSGKYKVILILSAVAVFSVGTLFGVYVVSAFSENAHGRTDTANDEIYEFQPSDDTAVIAADINSADIEFVFGNEFRIETDNSYISFSQRGKTVYLRERKRLFPVNEDYSIRFTVPDNAVLEKLSVDAGAGNFNADDVFADELDIDFGAGNINIKNAEVNLSFNADVGAGNVNITDGSLNNAKVDVGAGNIDISCNLIGSCEIDNGAGDADIMLPGELSEYSISVEKGLSSALLNGNTIKNEKTYGNGKNRIEIDVAVGNMTINTKE